MHLTVVDAMCIITGMNKQSRIAGALPHDSPRLPEGANAPQSLTFITADTHYAAVAAQLRAEGSGTGPRCIECRKNVAGCLCNVEEPDVMGVDDMRRVMPELFETGWLRAERCAYLMGGAK